MTTMTVEFHVLLILTVCLCNTISVKYGEIDIVYYREMVRKMFYHAYDGYLRHAYPYDELRPLTCDGQDTWGSYSLTLIDALDTLAVMENYTEFGRVVGILIDKAETFFNMDINVSVFETNIRVVGGLLSAHLLMHKAGMQLEPGWPCSGPLLRMAENIARKLLPAFDTETGMPFGTVNLRMGVPDGETSITCTAGVGTFIVEFGTLSRLTGDPVFEKVAMRAMEALWQHRSAVGLLGNHIDVVSGKWTALDSGIGGGIDSYLEYLIKGSFMFNKPQLMEMFRAYEGPIVQHLKVDDWYMLGRMKDGSISQPLFSSLDAYWPAIQSMVGDVDDAMKTLHNFYQIWDQYGAIPEYYHIPKASAFSGREKYPLRPELIESIMYLYRATNDPFLLTAGVEIVESIERLTRTECGYATILDVGKHDLENRMESFFLAETTKYLYLLFDRDNFIHNNGSHGDIVHTPNGDCILDAGGYIFNTEAHPIDIAAVHCCSADKVEDERSLQNFHDNLNILDIIDRPVSGMLGGKVSEGHKPKVVDAEWQMRGESDPEAGDDHGGFSDGQSAEVEIRVKQLRTECAASVDVGNVAGELGDGGGQRRVLVATRSDVSDGKRGLGDESGSEQSAHLPAHGRSHTEMEPPRFAVSVSGVATVSDPLPAISSSVLSNGLRSSLNERDAHVVENSLTDTSVDQTDVAGHKGHDPDATRLPSGAMGGLDNHHNSSSQVPRLTSDQPDLHTRRSSVGRLSEALSNYSTLSGARDVMTMSCPSRPFNGRLSVWGEVLDDADDVLEEPVA